MELFCLENLDNLKIAGRGGKEREIIKILIPKGQTNSKVLYDCQATWLGKNYRIEIKKQTNDQWFDSGKYYQLSNDDREIFVLFMMHEQGNVDMIAAIQLGALLDYLLSNPAKFERYGWRKDVLEIAHKLKHQSECPGLQFKAKLKVRDLINDQPDLFQIIYRRPN